MLSLQFLIIYIRNTNWYQALYRVTCRYLNFRESLIEKALNKGNILSRIILYNFKIIILFRYYCQRIGDIVGIQWLHFIFLFLSILLSQLDLVPIGWFFMFFIYNYELRFQTIHRFYQSRLTLIPKHFPDSKDPKRRMHKAAKVVADAIVQNPVAVTVATGAAGFVAWKYMDYSAAKEQRVQNDKTIESNERTHKETLANENQERQKDREVNERNHKETLANDDRHHKESLANENQERQKDREATLEQLRMTLDAEDRRHRETLEAENQKNRESLLQDKSLTNNESTPTEDFESTTID